MRIVILNLVTIFALSACVNKNTPTPNGYITPTKPAIVAQDTLTYLALGDSYTIGEDVPHDQNFPNLLAQQGYSIKILAPTIIARTGWTTDELIEAINQSEVKNKTYDMVTLLIGVNDQYRGMSQDNYRGKFQQLLHTAIKFAGGNHSHVFVLSIPDYGVTPYANGRGDTISPQIDQFNAINAAISTENHVNYIDITGISRLAANDLTLLASDGLHPSPKMYQMWVDKLKVDVAKVFLKQ
ncbi:lysophospholipase L1-like esterase [Mucilaginibacter oryzae]|uniref:Lysophospholipase L1-like esterase n=1 Tax=Mucilaginibacter oryzae TaxID=468058 RepID=A0A316H332_9SPHI|nr:SGNH/GDSL hydrolase family protein [Mucilaginibacter oryzae]PWK75284.1 lysophospholipase L1-like esterase [Mucilaginibacter oryzae]